jgi:WD40 repeat protein
VLENALQNIWSLAISHDCATLAAGGSTGNIILLDAKTNHQKGIPLRTDERGITRLVFSPDDKVLGAVSKDRIVFWNLDTGEEAGRLVEENDITDAVLIVPGRGWPPAPIPVQSTCGIGQVWSGAVNVFRATKVLFGHWCLAPTIGRSSPAAAALTAGSHRGFACDDLP